MSTPFYFFAGSEHAATDPLEGKYVSPHRPGGEEADREEPVALERFGGRYWFVQLPGGKHEALSTGEIADALEDGGTARSISGPFETREEAAQSLERYWEMIMDRD